MNVRIFAGLLAIAAQLASLTAVPGAPSADQIFARVRAALLARTFPAEIKYSVVVEGSDGKAWHGRTYDSFAFPAKGEIREKTVSREENANPYKPPQFGFALLGVNLTKGGDSIPDALGVPKLSPAYAFGLVPAPRAAPALSDDAPPGTPETIGQVSAIAKIYDVTLIGAETIEGLSCWHLHLKPLGNPGKYRVRDVWATQAGDQLVRLTTDGNFTRGDTGKGLWTVDYALGDGNAWYITSETSAGAVAADDGHTYVQMRVRFLEVAADPHEIYDLSITNEDLPLLVEP